MELNKEFVEKISPAIYTTWDAIGPDYLENFGEDIDNEEAIEACIDAGRLEVFAGKEAQNLLTLACKTHGYSVVLNYLNQHITLY